MRYPRPASARRLAEIPHVTLCQWSAPAFAAPAAGGTAAPGSPYIQGFSPSNPRACDPSQWPPAGYGDRPPFGQGAYVRPGRTAHVAQYRLRVDDVLTLVYRQTRALTAKPYRLDVGDQIRVEMKDEPDIRRDLFIQPDGTISLPLLGQTMAAKHTLEEFRLELQKLYSRYYAAPQITVTPLSVNAKLRDLLETVDRRYGAGGLAQEVRVTPEGTIALAAVGSTPVQGLTLEEVKSELDERYARVIEGLEVQPILQNRAPRFVYVLGEVRKPGRYVLEGPTTTMQAITLAGGVTSAAAANLKQVVVFRRAADWSLLAAMIDLYGPVIRGERCAPVNELWVADSDVVVVPKTRILVFDEFIEVIFTRGAYGVFPMQGTSITFRKNSTI